MTGSLPWRTERLTLRLMRPSDAEVFAGYRSDPQIARYETWELPYSTGRAQELLGKQEGAGDLIVGDWTTLAIELDGRVIGDVVANIDPTGGVAEIGYTLTTEHQGKGYATEAASAMVAHLFDSFGVGRVYAGLDPENIASQRVLEAIGLVFESHTKRSFRCRGQWVDNMCYAATREEYQAWRDRPAGPPAEVTLEEITSDTVHRWATLTTHHSENRFVATVAQSYADALFPGVEDGGPVLPWLRGVTADGERAGFVMTAEANEHHRETYLWRMLIDRRHQRRGIGRVVIERLVDRLRAQGQSTLMVSWVDGPGSPRRFYQGLGFVPTGEIDDGEVVARLTFG